MDLSWITESQDPIGSWNFMTMGTRPPPPEVIAAAAGLPLTAAGEVMTAPERFRRDVAERRLRDGIWDGRSRPTLAVLAAAERRAREMVPVPPEPPRGRSLDPGTVVSPERWQAQLDARRARGLGAANFGLSRGPCAARRLLTPPRARRSILGQLGTPQVGRGRSSRAGVRLTTLARAPGEARFAPR
jgi:hypothetical protein